MLDAAPDISNPWQQLIDQNKVLDSRGGSNVPVAPPSPTGAATLGTPVSGPVGANSTVNAPPVQGFGDDAPLPQPVKAPAPVALGKAPEPQPDIQMGPAEGLQAGVPQTADSGLATTSPFQAQATDYVPSFQELVEQNNKADLARDRTFGGLRNFTNTMLEHMGNFLEGTGAVIGAAAQGNAAAERMQGDVGLALMGDQKGLDANKIVEDKLIQTGVDYWNGDKESLIPAKKIMDELGVSHGYSNTQMSTAGTLAWNSIFTIGALWAAAPKMAAAEGMSVGALLQRQLAEAAVKNPILAVVGEQLSNIGSVVGSEKLGDIGEEHGGPTGRAIGESVGSVAGGMMGGAAATPSSLRKVTSGAIGGTIGAIGGTAAGGPLGMVAGGIFGAGASVALSNQVAKIPPKALRAIVAATDNVAKALGMDTSITNVTSKMAGRPPSVDPELLSTARSAEQAARDAGDAATVAGEKARDPGLIPGSQEHFQAQHDLWSAQQTAKQTGEAADALWDQMPKEVRGPYSHGQEAIRSKFADTVYPKSYAEDQVTGMVEHVQQEVKDALGSVSPKDTTKTTADYSADLADKLRNGAFKIADDIQDRYYNRVDSTERFSKKEPARQYIDQYVNNIKQDTSVDNIPKDKISTLYNLFADQTPGGSFKPAPTLGQVRAELTSIRSARTQAYAAGNGPLGRAYSRLENTVHNIIGDGFPDNVELQQARGFSNKMHEMIGDTDLGLIQATKRSNGKFKVHEEDVYDTLVKRKRGMEDLNDMVKWLGKTPKLPDDHPGLAYQTAVTPAQKAQLESLQDTATDTIKSSFQDMVTEQNADPAKVQKAIKSFTANIQAYGKVAGEINRLGDILGGLIKQKEGINKSVLSSYMKADNDKAVDIVWSAKDPTQTAKMLINGEAGVGGFAKDPRAMTGFRALITDRFFAEGRNDPARLTALLDGPHGRMLETVLSPDAFDRVGSMIKAVREIESDAIANSGWKNSITFLARLAALKVAAITPKFGKGGELQKAALFSSKAKYIVEKALGGTPIETWLRHAVEDPKWEHMLQMKVTGETDNARELTTVLRRMINTEVGIRGIASAWDKWATDKQNSPGKIAPAETDNRPYSRAESLQRLAGDVIDISGPMQKIKDQNRRDNAGGFHPGTPSAPVVPIRPGVRVGELRPPKEPIGNPVEDKMHSMFVERRQNGPAKSQPNNPWVNKHNLDKTITPFSEDEFTPSDNGYGPMDPRGWNRRI